MDSFARTVSESQHLQADDHIAALNDFLGMSSPSAATVSTTASAPTSANQRAQQQQQQHQQQRQQQAMAAFLASTTARYTDIPAMSVLSQNSPLMVNTVDITPSQSIQSMHLGDFGAATLAASQNQPGTLLTSTVDMSNQLYNNSSLASMDSASLTSMLSAPAQQAVFDTVPSQYNVPQIPTTSGFLTPAALSYDQAAAAAQANIEFMLGKRKYDDTDMGYIQGAIGVPLSKRVSMPASYGDYQSHATTSTMPIPSGISMQRISSYHPSAYAGTSPNQGLSDTGSNSSALPMAPTKLPISRLKTMPASTTSGTSKSGGKRTMVSSTVFSAQTQPQPNQYQRKVAHNAIERRYRNNINDRICDLRNSVPALQHIRSKKKPHTTSAYARDNADSSNDEFDDDDDDDGNSVESTRQMVDGVEAATKLNKATILGKSTEYIYHLRRTNDLLRRESAYLQEIVRNLPDGDKIMERVLQRARDESAIATIMLRVPERATVPKKKSQSKH
ncbi:hypothetical protein LPJ53_000738 [Coemansia erecta]|uniref:BHLH domain-containing protein n=1 Tax=Coemansia erecta TaxID=147472 RepID=A0A9W7Y791_9FUNG|nr:hypothetical protein LPJ53_000738 [Coemansia erecta]